MSWFKDFYEVDYYKYYFEPKLQQVPAEEVEFICRQGRLDLSGPARPRVFDICCGIGRHARPLAARGAHVVGVDISTNNIQAAQQRAVEENLEKACTFVQGDIRQFTPPAGCDLAINIFTSFGYFGSDEEDAVILAKASQSLRPGGRFILDIANREATIGDFKPHMRRGTDDNYVIDDCRLDLANGKIISHWTFVRDGQKSEHTITIRLYALHELIRMAQPFGLRFVEAFGSFAGEPYSPRSPRCIFVAEKE